MNFNEKGLAIIKHFENYSSKPYLCPAGVPTIGWGNTRYIDGKKVTLKDKPLTPREADLLLYATIAQFAKDVRSLLKVKLNDDQFSALVSFAYNVGSDIDSDQIAEGLRDSILLKKVNEGAKITEIRDEWIKWNKSGGVPVRGLRRRRASEYHLFAHGEVNYYEAID